MTDLERALEEERRITNAATAGPWDFQPWSKYALPSGEYAESILLANASPDGEITREMSDEDGQFIAHARTALPLRNAQLDAVLALHRKSPLWGHEDRCEDTTGGHREERHELIDGELWCRDIVDEWTCAECAEVQDIDSMGERPAWPCATVRAIEEA